MQHGLSGMEEEEEEDIAASPIGDLVVPMVASVIDGGGCGGGFFNMVLFASAQICELEIDGKRSVAVCKSMFQ